VVACQIPEVVAMDTAEPVSSAETPDMHGAYPRLSEPQIQALAAYGMRRRTRLGDVLFREGDPTCDFFVVLEGKVAIVEGYGAAGERVLSVHDPGRFLGELSLLTGEAVFVTAVVREPWCWGGRRRATSARARVYSCSVWAWAGAGLVPPIPGRSISWRSARRQ
jgi:CRP-like cAMP-binding protein